MKLRRVSFALALLPVVLAFVPRADKLGFQPAANATVEREYSIEANIDQIDISASVNGADMSENIPGDLSVMFKLAASVSNKFVESRGGKPIELIRGFDKLSVEFEMPEESESKTIDELEGKHVRFKWNEETSEYDKSFHESEGDAQILEALAADMDLTQLLPTKEVSEGDTWTVPGKAFNQVISFGMESDKLSTPEGGEEAEMMAMIEELIQPQADKLLESMTATCTYKGTRQVGDRSCAAIELSFDASGEFDLAQVIRSVVEKQVPPEMEMKLDVAKATIGLTMKGQGMLLWDVAAGLMHDFNLASDIGVKADMQMSADAMGQNQDVDAQVDASGTITWKVAKGE